MSSLTRKICEVAKVKGGKRLPKGMSVLDEATEHPYLRVVDFADGGIDRSDIKYISSETFHHIKRYTIDSSDVYISIAGTIGRVGVVPDELSGANLTENAAKITEISDDVDHRYLMYYLRSPVGQGAIKNRTGGTSQPKLALYKIASIDFPCRPLASQCRIASILSTYDDLIENNRRRIHLLEQAARLLYKEWFVHLRFPGHKHSNFSLPTSNFPKGVPEGWEKKTVGQLSSFISRGITPRYDDEASGLVINQKCIRHQRVDIGLARHQSKTVPRNKAVQSGDVLINSTGQGTLGRVAQSLASVQNCTVDSHVMIARPADDLPRHLYGHSIASMQTYLATMGRGATNQTELSKDTVADLPFLLPPRLLAEQFEEFAGETAGQVQNLIEQNVKLAQARDLLLPRLMNGEVVV